MIWTLILALITTQVMAATEASFVDACSGVDVSVSNPNGIKLKLKITNLNPSEKVDVTVTYRPAGVQEDIKPHDIKVKEYSLSPMKDFTKNGTLKNLLRIPKEKWLSKVEKRHSGFKIWDAEVTWIQHRVGKAGSAVATFYHSPKAETFFQIVSGAMCQWESEASVDSKLYENLSPTWMSVSRSRSETWDQGNGPGMTVGYNNNTGGSLPLSPVGQSTSVMGWVFKDFQKQFNNQYIFRNELKYTLSPNEAGVFTTRMSFNRHRAKRYDWVENKGSCDEYRVVSEGDLDIGKNSEDFIVIPKNYFGRTDKLNEFIRVVRPTLNNCGDNALTGPQHASEILPSGMNGILYYYQLKNNRSIQ